MNPFILGSLSGVSCVLSWWLTGRVRRYALNRRLLDIPNPRSSHAVATPRGGGMAIVVTTLAVMIAAAALGDLSWRYIWGPLGGGAVVAVIGFVDDHRHLRRRWRLLGHFAAAVWVEKMTQWRITMLPGVLLAARHTVMLVCGADKAEPARAVFNEPDNPRQYPAQIGTHHGRSVTWFMDADAAKLLDS